jgi:hypothetical protein
LSKQNVFLHGDDPSALESDLVLTDQRKVRSAPLSRERERERERERLASLHSDLLLVQAKVQRSSGALASFVARTSVRLVEHNYRRSTAVDHQDNGDDYDPLLSYKTRQDCLPPPLVGNAQLHLIWSRHDHRSSWSSSTGLFTWLGGTPFVHTDRLISRTNSIPDSLPAKSAEHVSCCDSVKVSCTCSID